MSVQNPRDTYLAATVSTASPAQLLVMLYERLNLDVERAAEALRSRPSPATRTSRCCTPRTSSSSCNASLKVDAWEGAAGLSSLYDFLHSAAGQGQHRQGPRHHRVLPRAGRRRCATPGATPPSPSWRCRHDRRGDRDPATAAGRAGDASPALGDRARPPRARGDLRRAAARPTRLRNTTRSTRGTSRSCSGPIPADLVDRAVEIRQRQERAERALAEAADLARRQHQFAARVDRATGRHVRPAVYLDLQAEPPHRRLSGVMQASGARRRAGKAWERRCTCPSYERPQRSQRGCRASRSV